MLAGKLDRRISIERASTAQDDTGQEIETWLPVATVWASWRRASARETLAAAEIAAEVTDVFDIRWSYLVAEINPKDQIIFDGRTYDISAVAEIGRREGMQIAAVARADG
ncbi:MAG: phage head closure protein [Hyphomicrobium sp.]|jgi:SPP1 family predicted phage head-tail adaptor